MIEHSRLLYYTLLTSYWSAMLSRVIHVWFIHELRVLSRIFARSRQLATFPRDVSSIHANKTDVILFFSFFYLDIYDSHV